MIELIDVTKKYGSTVAVSNVSFSGEKGQIIGLLGENGAGKTTTLNILTGYMPPTSGKVIIAGEDMMYSPAFCKSHIGYLPEKPPLYEEMTVEGYLQFVCSLRGVKKSFICKHVLQIMELCGISDVNGRIIGHLSKGYHQRVGMAQSLCGDPELIVLDEPTVGLDPKQTVEIRELIRRLGENHTVLFSSHILAEVQQLCSKVIILHHGKVIKQADMREMTDTGSVVYLRMTVAMKERQLMPSLRSLPFVRRVKSLPTSDVEISEIEMECSAGTGAELPEIGVFRLLSSIDAPIIMMKREKNSLEDTFLRITQEGR